MPAGISPTPCVCSALLRAHIHWEAELLSKCLLYMGLMDPYPQSEMCKYTLGHHGWTSWKQSTNGFISPKEEKQLPLEICCGARERP